MLSKVYRSLTTPVSRSLRQQYPSIANNFTDNHHCSNILSKHQSYHLHLRAYTTARSDESMMGRFTLSQIQHMGQDRKPLVSLMYYTGAMTHLPEGAHLCIPNLSAKKEYLQEVKNIIDWKPYDIINLRTAITDFITRDDIQSLCDLIQSRYLSQLSGNQVIHHDESSLSECFNTAFALSFSNLNGVHPEFKVEKMKSETDPGRAIDYFISRTHDGKFTDVVVDTDMHSEKERIHCIEFKNIKINQLKGAKKSWEDQYAISKSIEKQSDEDVLKKPLKYTDNGCNVGQLLQNAIQQAEEYGKHLRYKYPSAQMTIFVVLRVGLSRLIVKKL
ncbi:hypothetical protein SAMD00019534_036630, partial [Acytostelium subglobosum LB1]|uniref:hypothetical protein n=1 Tax=Acytostelium subglobosum LB1 TaxID=1410327 RepID=UPI000644F712